MFKWIKHIGPGSLIAAAFIGPGTVTVCTLAGAKFGFELLWAMLLSTIATIVLQEMAARVGIVTQQGLAATIKHQLPSTFLKYLAIALILGAVVIGNAAYEAGNISGSSLGLTAVFGEQRANYFPLIIGLIAFALLSIGSYKVLEKCLITLVILMSISFLVTAIITQPDLTIMFKGMFTPRIPDKGILVVLGIVGTTIVPYNLFLHASLVKEKWTSKDLKPARRDVLVSISLGGLVSMAIIVCAASMQGGNVENIIDLAKALEPLYGTAAKYFLGIGLCAAGITSAITAPLAAAYVARNCFGWPDSMKDIKFRLVWIGILAMGVVFASLDFKPLKIITFAQVANGLLLPIVAGFLIWIVNSPTVMGANKNTVVQNVLSILIVLVTVALGIKGILSAIG